MSDEQEIKRLLQEGREAVRAGDKNTARDRFEQVTELDENNERAWFYLASVVDTDEERRICLTNVLVINPNNERAQELMDKLDRRKREREAEAEVVPGISRRQLTMIVGGGVVAVLAIVLILVMITVNQRNQEEAARATGTALVQAATDDFGTRVLALTAAVETRIASIGTDTPTPRVANLPPTFTPSPEPSVTVTAEMGPAPPPDLAGNIAAFGGIDVLSNGALELYLLAANGDGEETRIGSQLGRDVRFAEDANRVVYTRYFNPTADFGLEAININGTQPQLIRSALGMLDAREPDLCNSLVAFVAVPAEVPISNENLNFDMEPPSQLYMIDITSLAVNNGVAPEQATRRLTNDSATYHSPAFSPDCSQIAVVRNDQNSAQVGTDILVINVLDPSTITQITTDLSTFIEQTPRWSPDGSQIVFAAAQSTTPNNNDIIVASATGSGSPQVPIRDDSDDILPVFSPDGRYLAFSSNRQGVYNIFIYSLADQQVWQVTNETSDRFVGDWWQ